MERLAGDVPRLGAGEIDHGGGDVLGGAEPAHRDRRSDPGALLLGQFVSHRRRDQARGDAIDRDAAGRGLGGELLCHADQPGFRRCVIRLAGIAGDPDHRGDRDHPAMAAPDHAAQCSARQAKGGGQIDLDDRIPILVAQAQRERVAGDPGIVDQDVDMAHRRLGLAEEAVGRFRIGEIGGERVRAFAEFGGKRGKRGAASPGKRDRGALAMERPADRAADPPGGAGHQRGLAGEVEHPACHAGQKSGTSASTSAGVPTERADSVRSIRLTSPASTRPAPISTTSSTWLAANNKTVSRQRTIRVVCSTSSSLICSGSLVAAAAALATSGTSGAFSGVSASASAMMSAAGLISEQWNGALTGSMIVRAPRSAASATARSTAPRWPLTTICPGLLSFARSQTWPCAAASATARAASMSRPSSAAIAPTPTGTAFCIAWPRRLTSRAASATDSAPAAASAEYSPSEWPAT